MVDEWFVLVYILCWYHNPKKTSQHLTKHDSIFLFIDKKKQVGQNWNRPFISKKLHCQFWSFFFYLQPTFFFSSSRSYNFVFTRFWDGDLFISTFCVVISYNFFFFKSSCLFSWKWTSFYCFMKIRNKIEACEKRKVFFYIKKNTRVHYCQYLPLDFGKFH